MKSIPEKATCETGLTVHRPECLSDIIKDCTFTLLDNAQQNNMGRYAAIRFSKIGVGLSAQRYTERRSGKRAIQYDAPYKYRLKVVRDMVSIKKGANQSINKYQSLVCRR